jgi:hypothetical protein
VPRARTLLLKKSNARQLLFIAIEKQDLEASASIEIAKHTLLSGGLILVVKI